MPENFGLAILCVARGNACTISAFTFALESWLSMTRVRSKQCSIIIGVVWSFLLWFSHGMSNNLELAILCGMRGNGPMPVLESLLSMPGVRSDRFNSMFYVVWCFFLLLHHGMSDNLELAILSARKCRLERKRSTWNRGTLNKRTLLMVDIH